jgi:hypothetical protein
LVTKGIDAMLFEDAKIAVLPSQPYGEYGKCGKP